MLEWGKADVRIVQNVDLFCWNGHVWDNMIVSSFAIEWWSTQYICGSNGGYGPYSSSCPYLNLDNIFWILRCVYIINSKHIVRKANYAFDNSPLAFSVVQFHRESLRLGVTYLTSANRNKWLRSGRNISLYRHIRYLISKWIVRPPPNPATHLSRMTTWSSSSALTHRILLYIHNCIRWQANVPWPFSRPRLDPRLINYAKKRNIINCGMARAIILPK